MNSQQFAAQTRANSALFEQVIKACQSLLSSPEAKEALDYLKSRASNNVISKFQFGYFPNNSELDLLFNKVSTDTLIKLNLFNNKSGYFTNHNLIFPLKDEYNQIIGLMGRLTTDNKELSKYKYSINFPRNQFLFGLNIAKEGIKKFGFVNLVEGQFDCITCQANGFLNTVACGGVAFGYYHLYLLKKYGVKKINLITDNDQAGKVAAQKIMLKFSELMQFQVISLPEGFKDVDQYIRTSPDLRALYNLG